MFNPSRQAAEGGETEGGETEGGGGSSRWELPPPRSVSRVGEESEGRRRGGGESSGASQGKRARKESWARKGLGWQPTAAGTGEHLRPATVQPRAAPCPPTPALLAPSLPRKVPSEAIRDGGAEFPGNMPPPQGLWQGQARLQATLFEWLCGSPSPWLADRELRSKRPGEQDSSGKARGGRRHTALRRRERARGTPAPPGSSPRGAETSSPGAQRLGRLSYPHGAYGENPPNPTHTPRASHSPSVNPLVSPAPPPPSRSCFVLGCRSPAGRAQSRAFL